MGTWMPLASARSGTLPGLSGSAVTCEATSVPGPDCDGSCNLKSRVQRGHAVHAGGPAPRADTADQYAVHRAQAT